MPRRIGGSRRRPHVSLICQSKSEHIIRDDDIADVDGRTLTFSVLVFDLLVLATIFASCQLGHRLCLSTFTNQMDIDHGE